MSKCQCQSYNRPDIGTEKPYIADPNEYFTLTTPTRKVCLDQCIKDEVLALWGVGIWTVGSCCGHNGKFERTIILEDWRDAKKAKRLTSKATTLKAWKLIEL